MLRLPLLLALLILTTCPACAKRPTKQSAPKTRFLDATIQHIIPGQRDTKPATEWKLLLIWNEAQPPKSFIWQSTEGGPLVCAVQKIHHYVKADGQQLAAYGTREVALKAVRRGDTLEIIPIPSRPGVLPKALKPVRQDALYYQAAGSSSWHYLKPVLRRLKDIVMQ
jgi:hypothetical protein